MKTVKVVTVFLFSLFALSIELPLEEDIEVNPEETGDLFEGDILNNPYGSRNGFTDPDLKWPGAIVPYEVNPDFQAKELGFIEQAINEYHKKTCIRFRKRTDDDEDYISITGGNGGCYSSVGRQGGKQIVNLQSGRCLSKVGTAEHELMHALGFTHEHNRSERDDYITVEWSNIQPGRENNFVKVNSRETSGYGVEYDYGSVMHYSTYAFSRNKKPTLVPKKEDVKIGQRDGFSEGDLKKINAMYKCPEVLETVTEHKIDVSVKEENPILSLLSHVVPKT